MKAYRSMLVFPHSESPTKTKRILGRSMSAKLGVPGEGVGSGAGVLARGMAESGRWEERLEYRFNAETRRQALDTRRTRPTPEVTNLRRRDSTVGWRLAAELIFARL